MKRYTRYASALLVAMFLFFSSVNLTPAQNNFKGSAKNERLSRIMDSQANIEEFRQEYLNYLSEFENTMRLFNEVPAVREKFNRSGLKPIEKITEAKSHIAEASVEELTLMRKVYAKVPNWREAPESLSSLLKPELRQKLQTSLNSKEGEFELDGVTDDCAFAIQQNHTNTDISIARGVSLGLYAVMEGFPTDLLSILARIAPIAAWAGAEGAVIGIETLKAIKDDCNADTFETGITNQITNSTNSIVNNDNNNTTAITTSVSNAQTAITTNDNTNTTNIISNDNANKTAIITNDNTNKDTIVTNDNNNKTTIVNNDNANTLALTNLINATRVEILNTVKDSKEETNNLLLRTQIEADLASTDGSTFVALYQTPGNVCLPSLNQRGLPQIGALSNPVQCGLLDLVRSIVRDTIANVNTSSTAAMFFAQGDTQRAAGQYKAAYTSYRKAYKAASM